MGTIRSIRIARSNEHQLRNALAVTAVVLAPSAVLIMLALSRPAA